MPNKTNPSITVKQLCFSCQVFCHAAFNVKPFYVVFGGFLYVFPLYRMCIEVQQAMNTKLWHLEEKLCAVNLQQLYQLTIGKKKTYYGLVLSAVLITRKLFCLDELCCSSWLLIPRQAIIRLPQQFLQCN